MNLIEVICVIMLLIELNGLASHIPPHSHHEKNEDHTRNPLIKEVENTFACTSKNCYNISEFRIAENHTMDCYNIEVLILFEIEIDDTKTKSFGYLGHNPNKGNYIKNKPSERSLICKSIKRFLLYFIFSINSKLKPILVFIIFIFKDFI